MSSKEEKEEYPNKVESEFVRDSTEVNSRTIQPNRVKAPVEENQVALYVKQGKTFVEIDLSSSIGDEIG